MGRRGATLLSQAAGSVLCAGLARRRRTGRRVPSMLRGRCGTKPRRGRWLAAERERRAAEVEPLDPANMTVEQVAQHYLFWAEKRRDAGKLSPIRYESKCQASPAFRGRRWDRAWPGRCRRRRRTRSSRASRPMPSPTAHEHHELDRRLLELGGARGSFAVQSDPGP